MCRAARLLRLIRDPLLVALIVLPCAAQVSASSVVTVDPASPPNHILDATASFGCSPIRCRFRLARSAWRRTVVIWRLSPPWIR